jgi:DNA (cytosine-5)-methyltransferase 1
MRYLSVCSGIEACSVAWHPLGWTPAGFSEIEAFPRAVLQEQFGAIPVEWDHRYSPQSNVLPLFGDFTKIEEHHVGPIDLLVGGTPCQSFSVAGKRLGLDDPRGNLTLEFLALAGRLRPRWLCWENVPGVLSDDGGRTMGTFLGIVGKLGYRGCYRVLDAQFVRVDGFSRAVPQRRRRVFFVGHLGDDARAVPVLFERESLLGHPAPRREAGQGIAPTISARTKGGGGLGTDFDLDGGLIHTAEVAPTLNAAFGDKLGLEDQHINGGGYCSLPPVSMCLNAGAMGRQDAESETLIPTTGAVFDVAHTLKADGFDASEDGTGRGTPIVPVQTPYSIMPINSGKDYKARETDVAQPIMAGGPVGGNQGGDFIVSPVAYQTSGNSGAWETGDITGALDTGTDQNSHIIAFSSKDHGADAGDIAPTLRSMGHDGSHANGGGQVAIAIQAGATRENPSSGPDGVGVQEGHAYTLEARAEVQAVAFDMRGREGGAQFEGPHQTANIRAASGGSSKSYVAGPVAFAQNTRDEVRLFNGDGSIAGALAAEPGMKQQTYVASNWAVRRLTPRECERLQGFPDDWTAVTHRGKPAADGPRYKAIGNSMAVNVMRWIGTRIDWVERIHREGDAA